MTDEDEIKAFLDEHEGVWSEQKIKTDALALIETPEPTDTFQPIAHHKLAETLIETLSFRHINVVDDEYDVSPYGMKMFGLLQLEATFLDIRFSIAVETPTTNQCVLA